MNGHPNHVIIWLYFFSTAFGLHPTGHLVSWIIQSTANSARVQTFLSQARPTSIWFRISCGGGVRSPKLPLREPELKPWRVIDTWWPLSTTEGNLNLTLATVSLSAFDSLRAHLPFPPLSPWCSASSVPLTSGYHPPPPTVPSMPLTLSLRRARGDGSGRRSSSWGRRSGGPPRRGSRRSRSGLYPGSWGRRPLSLEWSGRPGPPSPPTSGPEPF